MSKKILCAVLCLLMCLSLFSAGALAAEEDEIVPNEEIENANEETIEKLPEEIEPELEDAEPLAAGPILGAENFFTLAEGNGVVMYATSGKKYEDHRIRTEVYHDNSEEGGKGTTTILTHTSAEDVYGLNSKLKLGYDSDNQYWYEVTWTDHITYSYPDSIDKRVLQIYINPDLCYHTAGWGTGPSAWGCWDNRWQHRANIEAHRALEDFTGAGILKQSEAVTQGDKVNRTIKIYVNGELQESRFVCFPNRPDDSAGNRTLLASDISVTPKAGYTLDTSKGTGGIEVNTANTSTGTGTYKIYLQTAVYFDLNSPSEDLLFENSAELSTMMPEALGTDIYTNGIGKISQHYAPASQTAEDNEIGYDEPLWAFDQKSGSYTKLYLKGWNTKPDGSGDMYTPGEKVWFEKVTTLYAIWGAPYEIRYYAEKEPGKYDLIEAQTAEALIGSDIIIPDGEGYGQLDHLKTADYDHGYQEKIETVKADGSAYVNVKYAKLYEINYKVSPDCAGLGTLSSDGEIVLGITDKAVGATAKPLKGCVFAKWVDESGATVSEDAFFAPEKPEEGWDRPRTYYACFKTFKVEYDAAMPDNYSYSFDKPKIGTVTLNIVGAGNTKDVCAKGLANLIQKTLMPGKETPKYVAGELDASKGDLLYAYKDGAISLFRFDGWETEAGERYAIGDTPEFLEDTTLYAVWSYVGKDSMKGSENDKSADTPTDPTDPTDPNPPTGDESLMGLWAVLMLVSTMGLAICVTRKKRVK